jgi:hypothetical protein
MSFWRRSGDRVTGKVQKATVQGPVVIGMNNSVDQHAHDLTTRLSNDDAEALRGAFASLRSEVDAGVAEDQRVVALQRVDELETALTDPEPDATTVELVLRWFRRYAPKLAGAVAAVVVHPAVGALVAAAGDAAVAEFDDLIKRET